MSQPIVMKGNKYGITIRFDETTPFEELKALLKEKLVQSSDFFQNARMALSFEGRKLTVREEEEVLDLIETYSKLKIICILDHSENTAKRFAAALALAKQQIAAGKVEKNSENQTIETYSKLKIICILDHSENTAKRFAAALALAKQQIAAGKVEKNSENQTRGETKEKKQFDLIKDASPPIHPGQFYRGTLRNGQILESERSIVIIGNVNPGGKVIARGKIKDASPPIHPGQFYRGTLRNGQILESERSIVIIGNVNPGGKVIARGNIVVLGTLKGSAYAGCDGKQDAFIAALNMIPTQLRIHEFTLSPGDKLSEMPLEGPRIAVIRDNRIQMDCI